MAKQTITDMDKQIKLLQEKKKEIMAKRNTDVGSYLIQKWNLDSYSTEEIIKIIDNSSNSIIK